MRAALYLRISTDQQSTADQERGLRAAADRSPKYTKFLGQDTFQPPDGIGPQNDLGLAKARPLSLRARHRCCADTRGR